MPDQRQNRSFERAGILAVALASVFLSSSLLPAAEPEKRQLWIYTSPLHCTPCKRLDKALTCPPMNAFQVIRLTPPPDTSYPCIYWKDAKGVWRHFMGWSKTGEAEFLAAYRKSGRVL